MFLKSIAQRGYPENYLLSRIKGRRTSIIRDWSFILREHDILHSIESIKGIAGINSDIINSRLWKEYYWVYSQMNEVLRKRFHNFFEYMEIMRLIKMLRYKKDNDIEMIKTITLTGLMSEDIEDIILYYPDFLELIREIERRLLFISNLFNGLREVYEREGFRGMERFIINRYLETLLQRKMDKVMRDFFIYMVDSRNIMSLYKSIRWSIPAEPYFISGGRIEKKRFLLISENKRLDILKSLIMSITGTLIKEPQVTEIENALSQATLKMLIKKSRESSTGLILHYLWNLYIEARNIRTLLEGVDMDREILSNEVIS